jgi:hypothetical protein
MVNQNRAVYYYLLAVHNVKFHIMSSDNHRTGTARKPRRACPRVLAN